VNRRTYLGGATGVVVALAGCSVLDGDGGEDTAAPEDVARSFVVAMFAGDADTVNELLHPDSPMERPTDSDLEGLTEIDVTVGEATVVSESQDVATVAVSVSTDTSRPGVESPVEYQVALSRQGGEWLVTLLETPGFGNEGPSAPNVRWETSERTDDAGAVTAVAFRHGGGDDVRTEPIEIVGGGREATPDTSTTLSTGDAVVARFGDEGAQVPVGREFDLAYELEDGGTTILATHVLTSGDTAGALDPSLVVESS